MGENLNKYGMKPLTKKNYFVYGLGNFASQLSWTMVSTYLFYTDVFGLGTGAVALLMLIAKVWDGINDPMMGTLMERTHTKWGRFRPYIVVGAVFLVIFTILTFTVPGFSSTGKRVYYIHWSWNVIYHDKCSIPGITVCNDTGPERNQPVKCGTDDGNDNRTDRFKSICIKACVMVWKR